MFNLKTEDTIRENFITDGTVIKTPYGININPYSNNVYITEARDYTTYGDLLCFNQQGQLMFRLNNIGLNPNTLHSVTKPHKAILMTTMMIRKILWLSPIKYGNIALRPDSLSTLPLQHIRRALLMMIY